MRHATGLFREKQAESGLCRLAPCLFLRER